MLEMFRRGAQTTLAKIFLIVVALSFVLYLGDFRGALFGSGYIAKVGGTAITQPDLERAFENEIAAISQRAGRRLTPSEARAFGLDRRALSRLIGMTALDHEAHTLGLAISEATAVDSIARDPSFQGFDGKFDRQGFNNLLRSVGMRENDYIALRRKEEARDQLTQSVLQAVVTPKPLVKAIYDYRQETRKLAFFGLDGEKAVTVPEPDAAKLKETYEANKAQFMAPEYRQLSMLLLSVDEIKTRMPVSDAEVAQAYEDTKDTFATPELRRVQQLSFKDKAAADAAKAAITGGKNFMTVAQEMNLKDSDVDLGLVNKKSLIDPKIANAAFALEKDKVSDVVEGRFATVILRVPEIIPGKQPSLAEVKDRILDRLQREKARAEIRRMRDEVEDLRTAGKSDKEVAEVLKLKHVMVPETDQQNKTKDGKPALEHPDAAKLVASGFDAKTGIDREPVDLADGGFGWVTTEKTTPVRQKTFEEVEADVKALYVSNERQKALRELGQKLMERLAAGESIETVASEFGAKPETTDFITRNTTPQGLTETAVRQAFAIPAGKATHTESQDRKGRVLVKVVEVRPAPEPTKEAAVQTAAEVGQQIQADTFDAFINAVQDRAGVQIDEAKLQRAFTNPGQ